MRIAAVTKTPLAQSVLVTIQQLRLPCQLCLAEFEIGRIRRIFLVVSVDMTTNKKLNSILDCGRYYVILELFDGVISGK